MPILTYDHSYISPTLAWDRARAWVECSATHGFIADGEIVHGDTPAPIDRTGTGSVELFATTANVRYQMVLEYWRRGENARRIWKSGWFEFTEDADLADLVTIDVPGVPTTPLGEHEAATTDVHGIPDTSLLETQAGAQAKADAAANAVGDDLAAHTSDTDNPHEVTAAQVGAIPLPTAPAVGQKLVWNGTLWVPGLPEIVGTGSPEGVVAAVIGATFINSEAGGYNGARVWRKRSGTGATGWVVANGDTGWRDITALLTSGWTGEIKIMRRESMVTFVATGLSGPATSGQTPLALPGNFAPNRDLDYLVPNGTSVSSAAVTKMRFAAIGNIYVGTNAANNVHGSMAATFPTDTPWPTTLPGSPA